MATLEKPKKEKTKKSKPKPKTELLTEEHDDDEIVEDQNPTAGLEQFEIIAPTTKHVIISHECSVSAEFQVTQKEKTSDNREEAENDTVEEHATLQEEENELNAESAKLTEDNMEEGNISLQEELAQAISMSKDEQTNILSAETTTPQTPSAPPLDFSNVVPITTQAETIKPMQYPSLTRYQYEETETVVTYQPPKIKSPGFSLTQSKMKPFTAEQYKQIYNCIDLDLVKQFELEFLMNSLLESQENDPLYAALTEYYKLQCKLTANLQDIETLRKEIENKEAKIWIRVPITKSYSALCGCKTRVEKSITYEIAKVDGKNLEAASVGLSSLFENVCFTYTTRQIAAQVTKVKIDQIINEIISYPRASFLSQNGILSLQQTLDADSLACMTQLRRAITIVFSFIRKISPNTQFDTDLRQWLNKLISLHLLLATREDHWFLLFNILRCPSGVGNWATPYIQVPCSLQTESLVVINNRANELPMPLESAEINNCIAVLQILLFPIAKRNEYLKAFAQSHKEISDSVKTERWILIDSDGEDSHTSSGDCVGLKESDLISFLNQIPFERLFCSALKIEKFLEDYIIEADMISANQMLKVVAFFTKLIEIFGEGMLTYNTERYKQLAKRLGRFVRHTLQYVFDYYELFIHNNLFKDPNIYERIAVELNALLLKACVYIYRTRNLATWQYFSSLPFSSLETEAVWQLFFYLNVGFPNDLSVPSENYLDLFNAQDFWLNFNVANSDVSAEDMYYLLQTFFEMANERDKVKDWDLIKTICNHIFYIGYVNESTRDMCYKTARDMLLNLTLAYEDLISCLLLQLKIRFGETEKAAFLIKSLPLENWKPNMDSFEILSTWLLHYDFKTSENMVARIIISHLNWGFDYDGRLFLPHNIHVRMACLITEALTKHAPEVIGVSTLTESVRQVTNLLDFSHTTKEHFTNWCWSMISILRLHLMDQSKDARKKTLTNPTEPLLYVPELERIDAIYQGVTENRPLAIYVALLVSLHGHSIPLICQKGFDLMKLLLNHYRHAAVIRSLEVIIPLFLESSEALADCEKFQVILNNLLNADKTYLKMAKDVIYPNTVGPVLELFENMLHHQITTYMDYGLSSPLNLIYVWLNCFTALPNWQNTSIVYLLDKLLRIAYQFSDAWSQSLEFFQNYYKDCDDWKGTNKVSSIKNFFGATQSRLPAPSPNSPWLSLLLLEIEFKVQDAHMWPEFLRQLTTQNNGKNNLDAVIKKTASIVKFNAFPANMLVIYKYANLISSMDINHALFPILNQKFFELYLSRVPLHYDQESFQSTCGVSDQFYEFNVPLMKKIKTNLKAAEAHYTNEATKMADDEAMSYFYRHCSKMMKAYELWLEETAINRFSKDTTNFPPQYNNEKLREILNGNTRHWTEFIYLPAIRKEQRYQADQWARKCFRFKTAKTQQNPLQSKTKRTAMERIKIHLRSYDKIKEPPKYINPNVMQRKEITQATLKDLKNHVKTLTNAAKKFNLQTGELNALNRSFLETVVKLYTMATVRNIVFENCNPIRFTRNCSSPAQIETFIEDIRKDEAVQRRIDNYHERHNKIIDEMLTWKLEEFAQSIEIIGYTIRALLAAQQTNITEVSLKSKTGIEFFYHIVENMTDVTMKFQPTLDCFNQLLNELGIFIQNNQEEHGIKILDLALKRPELLKELSGVFVPFRTRPEYFIKMYNFLIDSHLKRCDTKVIFVLFSKFDLETWLENYNPKLHDIDVLLQLVLRGLESWSQPDSKLLQDLFRRHLVHIYKYNFPEHYGEVLQKVLLSVSEQHVLPVVLLDLLNALLERAKCPAFNLDHTTGDQIQTISMEFARNQNLFNFKATNDTIMLFAQHFQKERLTHGLHGLYPKHKDYCKPLAMWFSCFGQMLCATSILTYQSLLADQISDILFGSIVEMYSPWLVPYTEQTMQQATSNWIRKLTENGQMLLPWSHQHANTSKIIIRSFINALKFILENLPASHKILGHTFSWYNFHFTVPKLESYTYVPIHEGLATLPWDLFKPQPNYINMFYESLAKFTPEAHSMLGHIFIRIDWNNWFEEILPTLSVQERHQTVSRLFTIFVKIAFEPNIHIHPNTSKILEDAINHPWYLVEYKEVESLLQWFITSVEPSIILKIPNESNYADRAVLDLLRLSCAMMPERPTPVAISQDTARRILYVRAYVRLLRSCAQKNQKLLATKDGRKVFDNAFFELLYFMDKAIDALANTKTPSEQQREAFNMIIEIVEPMVTQSLETTVIHVNTMVKWQQNTKAGNFLVLGTITAIGHMRTFIGAIYELLETTLVNYFHTSAESAAWHNPSWSNLLRLMHMSLDKLQMMPIVSDTHYLTLHTFIIYKLERMTNIGDQITFLQDLIQLVESMKTMPQTEARLAIIWGILISRGCKMLASSEHAKKPLLLFARTLFIISTQSEGWSDGLLGAIGLKRDNVTNKRKVLTRCLACVIFSLFPDYSSSGPQTNQEFNNSMQDLSYLIANKKFIDVKPLIVQVTGIINENRFPNLLDVPHLVCRLIGLCYNENFLTTIPEVWDFEFKLQDLK